MPEMTFYIVFVSQLLLVSFYLPHRILARMQRVRSQFPPSTHPRLYPRTVEFYQRRQRNFQLFNRSILVAGLVLLVGLFFYPRSGSWDHVIAMWFFILQAVPLVMLDFSVYRELELMRETNPRRTRTAELQARRFTDFVSPVWIGALVGTYLAFVVFIAYIQQFGFAWFGGYWNIVGITAGNLALALIGWRIIYGKKRDPHQSHEDRKSQIAISIRVLVFTSIAATLFTALNIGIAALDLRSYQPALTSLYFQILALISYQVYKIGSRNYDVYRNEELLSSET